MKPIGPLMREHRLIERMVTLLNAGLRQMSEENKANVDLLTVAVDFFRTYADRTHHGKEEDILFRELAKKKLSREHERIMNELVQEHVLGRKMVSDLISAKKAYTEGSTEALKDIIALVTKLVNFYPAHIEKEDKHFFYPILEYLSKKEQDNMLEEFWDFDRKLIHEKYQGIVEELEAKKT
jgi:hemerythrin-like domain-containing protein